jgi:hypothetical protein
MWTGMIARVRGVIRRSISGRIDIERYGIDVGKNRNSVMMQHGQHRGEKGEGRRDHFVSGFDSRSGHRDMRRRCSAVGAQTVAGSDIFGEFAFESFDFRGVRTGQDSGIQNAQDCRAFASVICG